MTTTPTAFPELPDLDKLEAPFQARVEPWMAACFGRRISADTTERNHRFIEEALELVQAGGMSKADVLQLVDYTYGRPIGELHQEVGGVMVTLAALCLAQGLDMHDAAEVELARIWTKVEAIRAKQLTKPRGSPLPIPAASLSPLCGAQPAESGKETAQLSIGFANNDQGVHVSVMQQHAGGAVTLLHQAKVPFGDSFARFAIAAQQATAPGVLYSYIGESDRYELLGHAVGAGKCKLVEPVAIYRDTATGNLYFRAPADFAERMEPIEDNTPEFGEIKTSAPGTPEAPPYAIMGIDWSTDYLTEQRAAMRDAAAQLVENAREGSLRADTARAIRALDATQRAAQLDGGQGGE